MGEDILVKNCNIKSGKESTDRNFAQMNSQEVDLNFVRQKLEDLHTTIIKDVDQKINCMIEDVLQDIRQKELQSHEFNTFARNNNKTNTTWTNRIPQNGQTKTDGNNKKDERTLPDKKFVIRESYLTALLEIDHMKSIYNIFFIILTLCLMNTICHDFFVLGKVSLGLHTIKIGLRGIGKVMGVWCLMHIPIFALYYALKIWADVRQKLIKNQLLQSVWSYSCLTAFVTFQISLLYVGITTCFKYNLPYIPGAVMLLETTRLLMKNHGFIRTNVGRILNGKSKTEDESDSGQVYVAPFSCFLYYLFAPTLIYRDSYPRTNKIRWSFALFRFLEVVAVAFLYSNIFERHIHANFGNYGIEEITVANLIVKYFGMIMPSFIILLGAFYLVLHAWLNLTAELLRFGDRMFYKDWWTAANYGTYYRNWNVVVHDWLYEYIYKDCYNHIFKGSKIASSLLVFFVSAFMHEVIIGVAMQVFYPVLFCAFGMLGVVLVFVTKDFSHTFGNMFLWFSLMSGSSYIVCQYSMEYFAKQNCPRVEASTWLEAVIPVSWYCNGIKF